MKDPGGLRHRSLVRVRLAILLTALSVAMAIALLIKETTYLFAAFMLLGPLLLLAAAGPARLDDSRRAARKQPPIRTTSRTAFCPCSCPCPL